MPFNSEVSRALGDERAEAAFQGAGEMCRRADAAPSRTNSLLHLVIQLGGSDIETANHELFGILERSIPGAEWATVVGTRDADGTWIGKASPYFRHYSALGSIEWLSAFALSDLHMRLGAWWLTQVWRDAELAEGALQALDRWNVLVAASCSRSLLEGAARLAADVPRIIECWDALKKTGEPNLETVNAFVNQLDRLVVSLQYSTRLFKGDTTTPAFESVNAVTHINKLYGATDPFDIKKMYAWLCDAVHPSLGSSTTYSVYGLSDKARSHRLELYERRPLPSINVRLPASTPHVARAAADALILSARLLDQNLRAARWIVDDIALTARLITPSGDLEIPFIHPPPGRNSPCPCGSGSKFKHCVHRWGLPGTPPGREVPPDPGDEGEAASG